MRCPRGFLINEVEDRERSLPGSRNRRLIPSSRKSAHVCEASQFAKTAVSIKISDTSSEEKLSVYLIGLVPFEAETAQLLSSLHRFFTRSLHPPESLHQSSAILEYFLDSTVQSWVLGCSSKGAHWISFALLVHIHPQSPSSCSLHRFDRRSSAGSYLADLLSAFGQLGVLHLQNL